MRISSITRQLLSLGTSKTGKKRHPACWKLQLQNLEDRSVPAVVTNAFANGILILNNPTATTTVTFSEVGTMLDMALPAGDTFASNATADYEVPAASVDKIVIAGTSTANLNFSGVSASLNTFLTATTEVDVTEQLTFPLDFSTVTKDVYTVVNLGGAGSDYKTTETGVNIVAFSPQTAASSLTIDTTTLTTGVVGLDFKAPSPLRERGLASISPARTSAATPTRRSRLPIPPRSRLCMAPWPTM